MNEIKVLGVIMVSFEFNELDLKGSYLISNFMIGDNRGGFKKCFEKDIYKASEIDVISMRPSHFLELVY